MEQRIIIVGGGTGGTLTANLLRKRLGGEVEIVVVDRDDRHVYQPGLLFVPFGLEEPDAIVRSRRAQLEEGIDFRIAEVEAIDAACSTLRFADDSTLAYDALVVASGASLRYEDTEGLTGPGWGDSVFSFYSVADAMALRGGLECFDGGHLVVGLADVPIKAPTAPLELCFLADCLLRERRLRDRVEMTFVTPEHWGLQGTRATARLATMLEQREIGVETGFATGRVDGEAGRLSSWNGREVRFDLLVTVPLHGGAAFVERSHGLSDPLGFVPVDVHTLQSLCVPNVFAIGDAASLPTPKGGSATHAEGETLAANVELFLAGEPLEGSYDGTANCFVESCFEEVDKLQFQPLYWHDVLR